MSFVNKFHPSIKSIITFTLIIETHFITKTTDETVMKSPYITSLFVALTLNGFHLTLCERRISQEEWHHLRFGSVPVPMGSQPTQWAFPGLPNVQVIQAPSPSSESQQQEPVETNVQDVEVGKDKLVLVNDQGSIKMLRASQLPSLKQNTEVTTQTPTTVLQMPLEQYLTKDSNTNPTKNPNQIEIISQNYGSGNRLPVAYATSSNQPDRPNVIYQTENNPCVKASDTPPIYIPAPQVSTTTTRSDNNRKMVRIIIEMPESMTRDIDEASRYAATQVRRLKDDESNASKGKRKYKKNVQEVIKKVIQTEENDDNEDTGQETTVYNDNPIEELISDDTTDNNSSKNVVIANTPENSDQKYIIIKKKGRTRGRPSDKLKSIDKYKKIIRVYQD